MSQAAADSSGGSGGSKPDACSVLWDNAQTSALGTAPAARFWIALEQNGPWGRQAATQSHLDPDLGQALDRMCREAGGRLILIRRPGTHSHVQGGGPHRVYLAGGLASRPWLLQTDLDDPARLTRLSGLDLAASGSHDLIAVQDTMPELELTIDPILLVCTNARRDVCCALRGRPVALQSCGQRPGQVWECSHTGGHRFAPTGVLLPYGQVFARLSPRSAVAAVDAATLGEVPAELLGAAHDRGRSHLPAPGQAAESIVRQQIQEASLLGLSTVAKPHPGPENTWQCRVSHVDGRHWDVVAVRGSGGDDRPESCGKSPVPTWQWSVLSDSGR